ncbi:MAG: c-type cytochrome [Beijerinckiaceae bacterium]|nr:c-type cytochrome [Beijerinckiaceae bacterium]
MKLTTSAVALALFASAAGAQEAATPPPSQLETCLSCHGEGGNSNTPLVPSIAGQPEFFITNQLIYMREGVRPTPQMTPFVEKLTDAEIESLARAIAALPAAQSEESIDSGLAARGQKLSEQLRCASCHLPNLHGQEQMPRLAGQRIDYMAAAMKAYRDSQRPGADPMMSNVVVGLSDADIAALAHFAATKDPR